MEIKLMKKNVLAVLMLISLGLGAQSKDVKTGDFVKEKKQDKSQVLNTDVEKKYQTILADNNRVFFDEIFETKYKKSPQYLSQTILGKEDDTSKFKNYNVVLANIINDSSKNNEDKQLAVLVTDFNNKYISFFNLREEYKDFYTKKYDSAIAAKYAADLTNLKLTGFDALNKQKDEMLTAIEDYKSKTCELKEKLDKLKVLAKLDNAALASQYTQIKKSYTFPYLQKVITDMSKNLSSYNEGSLLSCDNSKEKESAIEKKEERKEDKKDVVEVEPKSFPQKNIVN